MSSTPIQYGQYRVPPASEAVNFGVGQPAPTHLPLSLNRTATAAKLAEEDPLLLQYGYISGYPLFRQSLARFLSSKYALPVDPELLFATNGVTGSLALVASLFVSRGDVVMCENPSYFLALSLFRDFGLRIVPCPLDAEGLDVEALGAMLAADPALRPKFIYTIVRICVCVCFFHQPPPPYPNSRPPRSPLFKTPRATTCPLRAKRRSCASQRSTTSWCLRTRCTSCCP